jgi:hypothetical protein
MVWCLGTEVIMSVLFFLKKMFRCTLNLIQESHHFIVQIGKNKCSQWTKLPRMFGVGLAEIPTF